MPCGFLLLLPELEMGVPTERNIICLPHYRVVCIFLLILAPRIISDQALPKLPGEDSVSHDKFNIILVNPFENTYGDVVEFSVLVTTDPTLSDIDSPDHWPWSRVQGQSPMPPYFAINRCPNLFEDNSDCVTKQRRRRAVANPSDEVEITIGADSKCSPQDKDKYCNGPLEAETGYYVALVGYTENDLHSVGPFSERIVTSGSSDFSPPFIYYCSLIQVSNPSA